MNRFLSALLCLFGLYACCAWGAPTPAVADEFVVAAESPGEFVVSEQATIPSATPVARQVALPDQKSGADDHCEECEAAGYGPDGRKLSAGCRCGDRCPCQAGECGDENCPTLKGSTRGCHSCPSGRARPAAGRARGFLLPRLFGRLRGACRGCR